MNRLLPKRVVAEWMKSTPTFKRTSSVQANDTDMWYVKVPAGRNVTVIVKSSEHKNFALDVVDAATGSPLGSDHDKTRIRLTRFKLIHSDYIDIRIANRGPLPTGYELSVTC